MVIQIIDITQPNIMKKIFLSALAAAALMAAPQQVDAQAFLNKMKEKAQQATSNVAGKMLEGTKAGEMIRGQRQSSDESSSTTTTGYRAESHDADSNEEVTPLDISKRANQLQRQSRHVGAWDATLVTPSTAKFPVPLINELPAVPSAAEIANPTESAQRDYYMAIQKVALRAQSLSEDETCDKEQEELFMNQFKAKMMKAFGLNEREYAIFVGDIEGTEEEQKKVTNKVLGFDVENLAAAFGDVENMTDAEREAKAREITNQSLTGSTSAMGKVYAKYPTELKKYCNKTPAEMSRVADESVKLAMAGKEKESEALGKKAEEEIKAYQKTLSPAEQKEAKAFEAKMQKELQAAMMESMRSASPLGGMMASMAESQKKMAEVNAFKQKFDNYQLTLSNAFPYEEEVDAKDYKFAAADRKKVEDLRAKIIATDDPAVYNPLFVQAHQLITSYRQRAAQAWRADVEKRFNAVKSALPGVIKTNRQAIEDKIIPECMLYRAPLNLVLKACEILEDAYSEVPADYPPLYSAEVVRQVKIDAGEQLWWPEFYVAETVGNILAGKTIFKSSKGQVYQFNAGKWVSVPDTKTDAKSVAGETKKKSQKWTSADGKRTVTYVEEGGYFLLPEGDIIAPRAIEKQGNNLVWAEIVEEEDKAGNTVIKVIKYTYKL